MFIQDENYGIFSISSTNCIVCTCEYIHINISVCIPIQTDTIDRSSDTCERISVDWR